MFALSINRILLRPVAPLFVVLGCFGAFELPAQTNLTTHLQSILADTLLSRAQVGVSIRNIQTNAIVFEKNANQSFTPASNLKLLTTAAAINVLGADYRFTTKVLYSDSIQNGAFGGTLLVKGSGDPTLGSDRMNGQLSYQALIKNWVAAFKSKGVTRFDGRLVVDPTHFEYNAIPMDYTWGDIGNYYGAGSFGLNVNENQTNVLFKPGNRIGAATSVQSITPWDSACTFVNHVYTGPAGSGDESVIYSSPYNNFVFAEGTIPIGNTFLVKGSISNPSALLAKLIIAEMNVQGIVWNGSVFIVKPGENIVGLSSFKTLLEHTSPSLKEIAQYTNLVSNNLYAECLLKEVAFKETGQGTTAIGVNQVKRYLKSIGVDTLGMVLRDGSGMSPFNSVAPNQYTQFLGTQVTSTIFVNCIPVAGREGTVSHICRESGGKIRVKSGTMNGTTCYSGYVIAKSGKTYAVSLMVNKHEAQNRKIQRVLEKILMGVMNNG
ncbi:D-alanyl-D-alanine carboxypeptidase/D-alanyl-D-alanine endopeptidase [Cytophaga aurantiaca]|uniref:D-alanyl-D-alanine carboxypeptidase/D-alanyl-D-alanine endopeptidase n=1 Tax=Cytophaga aurantiaca TaxID=29530 RepID=UPI0003778EAA|nr:D-alanyl-D-alanine carboxypeptidase/D-alanyl-D-alanine-endopeptidase [Cytophaga aurantiaca]